MDDEHQRKLAMLGELVGSVLHELRNPLGVIESSLYLIRSRPEDAERRDKHLTRIAEQVKHAQLVITGLMSLLHETPLDRQVVDLRALVADAISTIESRVPWRLELEVASVQGESTLLRQVIHNLADNAQRAAHSWVSVTGTTRGDRIEVTVEDDGPGVPETILARLFEPLTTGRPDGTGLGLALSRRIAERHGGTLRHERSVGARFILELPLA